MEKPDQDRELEAKDLASLGYRPEVANRILHLLNDEDLLRYYINKGKSFGCIPVTRVSGGYPLLLRKRLGLDSPGVLWAKGDLSLLSEPTVSLVGSRELQNENRAFAEEVGRQAALQGYVLVSGNARGADKAAQNACLKNGGRVISVVADELVKQPLLERVLYLSEDGYSETFSSQRALSRNRVIHALGTRTFVAQSGLKIGGTWDGTVKNLRFCWSGVWCYDDGSEAMKLLASMGANLIHMEDLNSFYDLPETEQIKMDR
ncbi:MAG: DNA-processing protein DprA [Oscillospiraceae bacterium]|nr:DNA-processing protein DprA [Oscillospiraceae bacterium]